MRIVIAPNAFKNSLNAADVAAAISKGLQQSNLSCETACFPVGDGGDGTGVLLIDHLKGERIFTEVCDPIGRRINASFGIIAATKTAVIELADASGLRLLKHNEYDPLHANTYGTGELIKAALDYGATHILLCIGGSATIDAGTGILRALGACFFDASHNELQNLPEALQEVAAVNLLGLDERLHNTAITILCDVENTLTGEHGAANVFGPQKGATKEAIAKLDEGFRKLCTVVYEESGRDMASVKYGGASGGVSAGLHTFLHAKLVHGITHFLDVTYFDEVLQHADMVITGEGSLDLQTLEGKGPFGVAQKAKAKGLPVIGIAGRVPLENNTFMQQYFDVLLPIGNEAMNLETAMERTTANLIRTAQSVGNLLALKAK